MRVLLFGANGMLGQAIRENLSKAENVELSCAARSGADWCLDFTDDLAVRQCFAKVAPEAVINAAAIVSLQKCEESPSLAYLVNGRFVSILAEECRRAGCYLVHVSTDHYYAGEGAAKHREDDPVQVVNEYARSKYVGECLAMAYAHSVVLRTNIVGLRGNPERPTFLEWAVSALEKQEQITAFQDFYTSSLHVCQFAEVLKDILRLKPEGIYNLSCSQVLSKAEFMERLSKRLFHRPLKARLGSVRELQGARRADSLGLNTWKLENLLGYSLPDADEVMERIAAEYKRRSEANEIPYGD